MTLKEAKTKWNISDSKMIELLSNRILIDITIDNDIITLPDHNKIIFPRKNQNITCKSVSRMILTACETFAYTDYLLLSISENDFSAILRQMEKEELIERKDPKKDIYSSNANYICTSKGSEALHKRRLKITELSAQLNFKFIGFDIKANKG